MTAEPLQIHEFHACADPECLGKVHNLLAEMWDTSPDVSELDRAMFETAVIEIAANIIRHGNDEGSTLCNLTLEVYPDRLEAHLRDDGLIAQKKSRARGHLQEAAAISVAMRDPSTGAFAWRRIQLALGVA